MGDFETDDVQSLPENKFEKWGSTTRFKDYLYRISILGKDGVLPITEFPKSIELDDIWHKRIKVLGIIPKMDMNGVL